MISNTRRLYCLCHTHYLLASRTTDTKIKEPWSDCVHHSPVSPLPISPSLMLLPLPGSYIVCYSHLTCTSPCWQLFWPCNVTLNVRDTHTNCTCFLTCTNSTIGSAYLQCLDNVTVITWLRSPSQTTHGCLEETPFVVYWLHWSICTCYVSI